MSGTKMSIDRKSNLGSVARDCVREEQSRQAASRKSEAQFTGTCSSASGQGRDRGIRLVDLERRARFSHPWSGIA